MKYRFYNIEWEIKINLSRFLYLSGLEILIPKYRYNTPRKWRTSKYERWDIVGKYRKRVLQGKEHSVACNDTCSHDSLNDNTLIG